MKHRKNLVIIFSVLVFICLFIMFMLSSQNGDESYELSSFMQSITVRFGNKLPFLESITDLVKVYNIRKMGHMIIFFCFGCLIYSLLFFWNIGFLKRILFSISICLFIAFTDEFHQYFIPGRTFYVRDIFIDLVGSVFGICFIVLISFIIYLFKIIACK